MGTPRKIIIIVFVNLLLLGIAFLLIWNFFFKMHTDYNALGIVQNDVAKQLWIEMYDPNTDKLVIDKKRANDILRLQLDKNANYIWGTKYELLFRKGIRNKVDFADTKISGIKYNSLSADNKRLIVSISDGHKNLDSVIYEGKWRG